MVVTPADSMRRSRSTAASTVPYAAVLPRPAHGSGAGGLPAAGTVVQNQLAGRYAASHRERSGSRTSKRPSSRNRPSRTDESRPAAVSSTELAFQGLFRSKPETSKYAPSRAGPG